MENGHKRLKGYIKEKFGTYLAEQMKLVAVERQLEREELTMMTLQLKTQEERYSTLQEQVRMLLDEAFDSSS